jgi:pimeloyl-ACP methyl ester carboxylesterase
VRDLINVRRRRGSMADTMPLILLPGMAADERLFAPQRAAFPCLLVPAWIEPLPQESLRSYAGRLARRINPGHPCVVGGASFGGIVALEMAAHLQARACVLISSVRSPSELPWLHRLLRPAAVLGPAGLGRVAALVARASAPSLSPRAAQRLRRLSAPQAAFQRWASWAVLTWRPNRAARQVRVYQIHGGADRTFPIRYTRPDVVVARGGHLLSLTHPQAVNELLAQARTNAAEPSAADVMMDVKPSLCADGR